MKKKLVFNGTLLVVLDRVIGMKKKELMAVAGVTNDTWYRLMKSPEKISIQRLLQLCNALQIPVGRFFLEEGEENVIGNADFYVIDNYRTCYYDAQAMLDMLGKCESASYTAAGKVVGMTRSHMRDSLLSVTRLPVSRYLAVCSAFGFDPFAALVDPNLKAASRYYKTRTKERDEAVRRVNELADAGIKQDRKGNRELVALKIEVIRLKQEIGALHDSNKEMKQMMAALRRSIEEMQEQTKTPTGIAAESEHD